MFERKEMITELFCILKNNITMQPNRSGMIGEGFMNDKILSGRKIIIKNEVIVIK